LKKLAVDKHSSLFCAKVMKRRNFVAWSTCVDAYKPFSCSYQFKAEKLLIDKRSSLFWSFIGDEEFFITSTPGLENYHETEI
jgi:hypothetical protein